MMRKAPHRWIIHLTLALFVGLWTLPTAGLFITALRDRDQIAVSGWWTALSPSLQRQMIRTPDRVGAMQAGGLVVIEGALLSSPRDRVQAFGVTSIAPDAYAAGQVADLGQCVRLQVGVDGQYRLSGPDGFTAARGQRIFFTALRAPSLTLANYQKVIFAGGMGRSFLNSLAVAVPSTLIPCGLAAYAAYGLSWMRFAGRGLVLALVVGLLAVPLQLALIPLLRLYNDAGQAFGFDPKTYVGIWLAHTGFGLPLAICLLRNAMADLPREIVESARLDGAGDHQIFLRIVLPLCSPALASFAIFQFLWTWNDLLVALVFLGPQDDTLVLTGRLLNLMGSRGGEWHILAASAFVAMILPLVVFFTLQKYLLRGLLAGSVR